MTEETLYVVIAAALIVMVPLVPHLVRFRILVLRKLHWHWMANVHERQFSRFVFGVRLIMTAVALYLLVRATLG